MVVASSPRSGPSLATAALVDETDSRVSGASYRPSAQPGAMASSHATTPLDAPRINRLFPCMVSIFALPFSAPGSRQANPHRHLHAASREST